MRGSPSERQRRYFQRLAETLNLEDARFLVDADHWNVKDENLKKLDGVLVWSKGQLIIGRYRIDPGIHPNPLNIGELWFEFEPPGLDRDHVSHEEVEKEFTRTKLEALKLIDVLSYYFPKETVYVRASGRGFHIYVYVQGIKDMATFMDLLELIIEKAGVDHEFLGESEVTSSRRKIREYGAVNPRIETYSTCLTVDELREAVKYPFAETLEAVRYPEKILVNTITPALAMDLQIYRRKKREVEQRRVRKVVKTVPKEEEVTYLNLECVNILFNTVLPSGERRTKASKFLGIAYFLDHSTLDGFEDLAKEFAEIQSRGNHKLTFSEAGGWKAGIEQWLSHDHTPEWNCAEIKNYLSKCGVDFQCPASCPLKAPAVIAEQKETIFSPEVEAQAHEILKHGKPLDYVAEVGGKLHKGDSVLLRVDYLSINSPMLAWASHLQTVGRTGKGKTHHMETALQFLPPEYIIYVNDPSPKSFYYAQQSGINFDGRLVIIDDVLPEHIPVLKTLTSQNVFTPRHWTVDDQEFVDLNIPGSYVVWISSVSPLRDEQGQLSRRFLMVNPREDPELDEEVNRFILERRRKGLRKLDLPPEFEVVKCMTKILRQRGYRVLTPFEFYFPTDPQRTAPNFFMSLLEASAVVHVFQRRTLEKDGETIILAEPQDFYEAKKCWLEYMLINFYKVDATALKILEVLPDEEPEAIIDENGKQHAPTPSDQAPTISYLAKKLREAPSVTYEKLDSLYKAGLIDRTYFGSWKSAHYFWKTKLPKAEAERIEIKQETLTKEYLKEFLQNEGLRLEDFTTPFSFLPETPKKEVYGGESSSSKMPERDGERPIFVCTDQKVPPGSPPSEKNELSGQCPVEYEGPSTCAFCHRVLGGIFERVDGKPVHVACAEELRKTKKS